MNRIAILALVAAALACADTPIDPCTDAKTWTLAKGEEFPGAVGSLTAATGGGLALGWDFSAGGAYIQATPKAKLPAATAAAAATLTTDRPCTVAWRMRDENGRTFQSDYITLPAGTTRLVRTVAGPWANVYGGKAGTGPAPGSPVSFAILVDKRKGTPASGSLTITALEAVAAPAR